MPVKLRIALLIDCDNVSHNCIDGVLEELSNYGVVNVRHAHGDWNNSCLTGWSEKLHPNAIRPMQQFAYTKGKNATDSAMIIDAMDILYSKNIDAFALMTSDSDFTPLVLRIRESGLPVYGFGEKKTPQPFVDACSQFIYTERISSSGNAKDDKNPVLLKKSKKALRANTSLVKLLRTAVEQTADDDGWANLAKVASYISNNNSFSPINYGYKKVGELIKTTDLFKIDMRGDGSVMYIKDARAKE